MVDETDQVAPPRRADRNIIIVVSSALAISILKALMPKSCGRGTTPAHDSAARARRLLLRGEVKTCCCLGL